MGEYIVHGEKESRDDDEGNDEWINGCWWYSGDKEANYHRKNVNVLKIQKTFFPKQVLYKSFS